MDERFYIDNLAFSITNPNDAIKKIIQKAESKTPGYICVSNARATYIANKTPEYCNILNNSFLTLPDGKPIEWCARLTGLSNVKRTCGPDLFKQICQLSVDQKYSHIFYGSTPQIIENLVKNLKKKYPGIDIMAAISPPFGTVDELANDEIINKINTYNPTFVWIGLGAPKQEYFMYKVISKINHSILIGIGLVFEYEAGTVERAPKWMQRSGTEWLFRAFQQPQRLKNFYKPFFYILLKLLKKLK